MAAAKAEAERRAQQAIEAIERRHAASEGMDHKIWKKLDVARKAAAAASFAAQEAAKQAVLDEIAAAKAAAPIVLHFHIPYRRHDVYKELARHQNPLNFPSKTWDMLSQQLYAAGVAGPAQQVSVGLRRELVRRTVFGDPLHALTLECIVCNPPTELRYKMLSQGGRLSALPSIVGEEYDGAAASSSSSTTSSAGGGSAPAGGAAAALSLKTTAVPQLAIVLEGAPYGTRVSVHVGAHGKIALPSPGFPEAYPRVIASIVSCFQSMALSREWQAEMAERGYKPLEPKAALEKLKASAGGGAGAGPTPAPASPPSGNKMFIGSSGAASIAAAEHRWSPDHPTDKKVGGVLDVQRGFWASET